LYKQAVKIDSTHTNNLCNYGLFLSEERHQYSEAEKMYLRALEVS
jgi:Tfp pilus assembly protein PilF